MIKKSVCEQCVTVTMQNSYRHVCDYSSCFVANNVMLGDLKLQSVELIFTIFNSQLHLNISFERSQPVYI